MGNSVKLEIKTCQSCPHCQAERVYTGDSFEHCFRYICNKAKGKIIETLDTFEKTDGIPKWCPLR